MKRLLFSISLLEFGIGTLLCRPILGSGTTLASQPPSKSNFWNNNLTIWNNSLSYC